MPVSWKDMTLIRSFTGALPSAGVPKSNAMAGLIYVNVFCAIVVTITLGH